MKVSNVNDEEFYTDFLKHLAKDQPELLALQVDPMPYLYKARQFAVDHLATNMDS